jgi:hypothetical protein
LCKYQEIAHMKAENNSPKIFLKQVLWKKKMSIHTSLKQVLLKKKKCPFILHIKKLRNFGSTHSISDIAYSI